MVVVQFRGRQRGRGYIDLNPVAAGIAVVPEASPHTSITTRTDHAKAQGRASDLKQADHGSVAGSNSSAGLEKSIWLCPIEDRRELDSSREGMLQGFSLGNYLLLVDYTGRLFRESKTVISSELTGILNRRGARRTRKLCVRRRAAFAHRRLRPRGPHG
jgi:hypothetical protein